MVTISVLHPTVRPQQALNVYKHWMANAKHPERVEYIMAYDNGNVEAEKIFENIAKVTNKEPRLGCVDKINLAAEAATGDILVGASDDVFAYPMWDALIEEAIGDVTQSAVLAVDDGVAFHRRQDLLHCFIVTRPWYDKRDYALHPDFYHVFADDFFTAQAVKENCIIKAPHILLEHRHPSHDQRTQVDEFYKQANSQEQYKLGEEIFERLMKENELVRNYEPIFKR